MLLDAVLVERIDGRMSGSGIEASSSIALYRSAYVCAVFERERGLPRLSRSEPSFWLEKFVKAVPNRIRT